MPVALPPVKNILRTPPFRVSFPEVFQAKKFDETQKPRYSITALFQPFVIGKDSQGNPVTSLKPSGGWGVNGSEAENAKWGEAWLAIWRACNQASIDAFKKPMNDLDSAVYKKPFHKGEEKTYSGYGPGIVFVNMAATIKRPDVVNVLGETITADSGAFYAGCWARASVNPYAFANIGKGIAIGLGNLQKLQDGDRLDAFTSAEEDFGSDPVEFAGAGQDVEDDERAASEMEDDFAA